ncbi:hypothetical protein CM15mP43_02350 [bacterium]|nr:MAG: hypothetical protein CM15mP43_02350 [bacterium]
MIQKGAQYVLGRSNVVKNLSYKNSEKFLEDFKNIFFFKKKIVFLGIIKNKKPSTKEFENFYCKTK